MKHVSNYESAFLLNKLESFVQFKVKTNQISQVNESAKNVQINRKLDGAYENISQ